jgi:Lytic transglycolase
MRSRIMVSAALAFVVVVPAASAHRHGRWWCHKFYTPSAVERMARHTYAGTRKVSGVELRRLGYAEMCLRPSRTEPRVRRYDRHLAKLHDRRVAALVPPLSYAVASWYDDSGATASGFHSYYGVAVCGSGGGPCVPFGTRILFCLNGCVTAIADDHGPYVSGRAFDVNQNVAAAIGLMGAGVATVGYRIL